MKSEKPKSERQQLLLMLFGGRASRSHRRSWSDWIVDFVCGPGANHAVVLYNGMLHFCTRKEGCVRFRVEDYPDVREPAVVYRVWVTDPDDGPWIRQEKFTTFRTLLSGLRLLPPTMRCMNCVQSAAVLLGIRNRVRTAACLVRELERLPSCPQQ